MPVASRSRLVAAVLPAVPALVSLGQRQPSAIGARLRRRADRRGGGAAGSRLRPHGMFRSHILDHQEGRMMSIIRVA